MDRTRIVRQVIAESRRNEPHIPQGRESWSDRRSQVYLIGCPETKRVKIGVAKDPDSRRTQLQTGSPTQLTVLRAWWEDDALFVEDEVHRDLADARVHGEWFDATHPDFIREFGEVFG